MGQCLKNGPLKTRWHINGKETFIWISRGVRKESILKTLTLTYSVTIKCFGTHKRVITLCKPNEEKLLLLQWKTCRYVQYNLTGVIKQIK